MIDFHQHIGHVGRTVEHLLAHQEAHGVRQSVVLPIDRTASASERFPTEVVLEAHRQHPDRIVPFCHVDPRRPNALELVRRFHDAGARGFGEHKLRLACDAPESVAIYRLCAELGMPVLLHFEYGKYNYNFEDFEQVLRAHPETVFVGHAQAWWANVSADVLRDPTAPGYTAYPKEPVVRGGLTDRWLAEYPNLYGDLSAGSGLGALTRDPAFAREFVNRHRSKLLWATDCPCRDGRGDWGDPERRRECFAARSLPVLRELCADAATFADITAGNAQRVLGTGLA